jgi:lipopolysaccharide/colanic/teichoic acid biosynthesis glycosyltransferase
MLGEKHIAGFEEPLCPVLGSLDEMQRIVIEHKPARIIVALAEQRGRLRAERLVEMQIHQNFIVEAGVDAYERLTGKLALESLTPGSVLLSGSVRQSTFMRLYSEFTSILVAGAGILLSFPLFIIIALTIKLDSRGPILFCQDRVGLGGKHFKLLKFRSMHATAEIHSEWACDNDDRITRVGKWLRRFRIDELPQFINVLQRNMNIVGPRPHPVSNRELFTLVSRNTPQSGEQIPYYALRSSVRPGITGWAQVHYKYANGLEEEMEKLRYDLYYIKHDSLLLELSILYDTIRIVLFGHEISETDEKNTSIPTQLGNIAISQEVSLPSKQMVAVRSAQHHIRIAPDSHYYPAAHRGEVPVDKSDSRTRSVKQSAGGDGIAH